MRPGLPPFGRFIALLMMFGSFSLCIAATAWR